MCRSCSNAVAEKETDASIGTVMLIMNDDCGEPMRNFDNGGFACHHGKEGRRV